ncbi:Tudor Domain-Containing Protein 5, partial [Manis pentadactyla]
IHKTGPVLLYHHWPTFHREDVLRMGTGDILFWNINTFKPIFGFNASVSALPQSAKEVWSAGTHSPFASLSCG